jgi:hypothetical protein
MRLFHFSEEADIKEFTPRPVQIPAQRSAGIEWLNGPLVWAIDEAHQPMYLFARDCPRILLWPVAATNAADRSAYFGDTEARMIAYVESGWLPRIRSTRLYRYELPAAPFETLHDAGMWVAKASVRPLATQLIENLPETLRTQNVELRAQDTLTPLRRLWSTSLHVSGIRLRNARGWEQTARPQAP